MTVRASTGLVSRILGPHAFDAIFQNGCIEVRSGSQPSSADLAATGTLLGRITRDGLAWEAGSPTGGLQFSRTGRFAMKRPDHQWLLKGLAPGDAGWWRLLPNALDHGGVDLTLPRIDGTVRLHEADANTGSLALASLLITPSTSISIDHWWYGIPPLGE